MLPSSLQAHCLQHVRTLNIVLEKDIRSLCPSGITSGQLSVLALCQCKLWWLSQGHCPGDHAMQVPSSDQRLCLQELHT